MKLEIFQFSKTLAALALTGCVLQPAYQRPSMPVGANYSISDIDAPAIGATRQVTDLGWKSFFHEPRLERIIGLALHNNRDLRVAALNVAQVQAQYRIQRAGSLPVVNGTADVQRSRSPVNMSMSDQTTSASYSIGTGVSWELDFFGRVRSATDQALAQYFATAEAHRASEIALVTQVADQYLALRSHDEEIALTGQSLLTAEQSAQIAQVRFDGGTGTELDLRQAQGVVEQHRADLASQTRSRAQSEHALVLLVGTSLPTDLPTPMPFAQAGMVADVVPGLPSDLLTRRPDIMQAEQQLRAANANIGVARAAFFPSISLTGELAVKSPTLSGLFDGGQGAWSFAPRLTLPIFDGGRNVANLEVAQLKCQIAIAQYEKAIQTAFREVADGLTARGSYIEQIDKLQRYAALQQRRLELSQLRYQRGIDSYLNVLTAQNALYAAQQSLISARLARLSNLVNLYRALGGDWAV